ncbi:MAG TPA: flavodoxin-dependent (E)-4-hydroxy-3-methylbut-2-enyl-diphosphate synthase, partial [Bacteroidia bacterium]|nr:flavodoxin-dependent (E)-4-hydroxy-3-methylbut-2-enyl-diphosphate synthase [Bacteroidia bacterium]
YNSETWKENAEQNQCYPLFCADEYFRSEKISKKLNFVAHDITTLTAHFSPHPSSLVPLPFDDTVVLVFDTFSETAMSDLRQMFVLLEENKCKCPVIIKRNYKDLPEENFQLFSSTDIGGLLIDGFGDGVWIRQQNCVSPQTCNSTAFGILQAARMRISKTEYISCPSCGRTLFDLQETTARIRTVTDHLKGIKIGIMGCIVNGPGEMADADYGYVGTGPGKISLYKGKEVIKKNVPTDKAVDELIDLIKENGDWVEKPVLV